MFRDAHCGELNYRTGTSHVLLHGMDPIYQVPIYQSGINQLINKPDYIIIM